MNNNSKLSNLAINVNSVASPCVLRYGECYRFILASSKSYILSSYCRVVYVQSYRWLTVRSPVLVTRTLTVTLSPISTSVGDIINEPVTKVAGTCAAFTNSVK
ncbi:hypothetical protein ACFLWO_04540 [Chloroflexota bacterium]